MITLSPGIQRLFRSRPTLDVSQGHVDNDWGFVFVCEHYADSIVGLHVENAPTHTRQWADAAWCIEPEDVAFLYIWSAV